MVSNMKKICIAVCVFLVAVLMFLPSCGNMSLGIGNYTFTHIHITDYTEGHCLEVEKWYDSEGDGIEVKTTDGGAYFLSEGTYTLISDKYHCPYCNGG